MPVLTTGVTPADEERPDRVRALVISRPTRALRRFRRALAMPRRPVGASKRRPSGIGNADWFAADRSGSTAPSTGDRYRTAFQYGTA